MTDEERFLSKIKTDGRNRYDCWFWDRPCPNRGYGQFYTRPKMYKYINHLSHRFSYELFIGKIPKDLCVDHLCRNRNCMNPGHMELVTIKENVLRGESFTAKNAKKKFCKYGHPLKGYNLYLVKTAKRNGKVAISRHCRECGRRNWRKIYNRKGFLRQQCRN